MGSIWDGGGGTEIDTYTNTTPTPETLGGIDSGATFTSVPHNEMWDKLLYAYINPSIATFSISAQPLKLEVGNSVPASKTFLWTSTTPSNIITDSIDLLNLTAGTTLVSGIPNTGSYTHSGAAVTRTTAGINTWKIQADQVSGPQLSRTFSVLWNWKLYYGESLQSVLDEDGIKALRTSNLNASASGTYNFLAGGYKYVCCEEGVTISSMEDAITGFNIPFETLAQVLVTNNYALPKSYNVYRTENILNGAIAVVVS